MTGWIRSPRDGEMTYRVPDEAGEIIGMCAAAPPNSHLVLVDCAKAVVIVDTRTHPPGISLRLLDWNAWKLPGGI